MRELTSVGTRLTSVDEDEDRNVRRSSSKSEWISPEMKELVKDFKEASSSAAVKVGWLAAMKLMWWRAASEVWCKMRVHHKYNE